MPMRMPMYSTISISHLAPAPIHYHNNSPPSRQRSASTHSSPAGHRETQPFVPVIQRSADDSSNLRETTLHLTLNQISTSTTHTRPSDSPFIQSLTSSYRISLPYSHISLPVGNTSQQDVCWLARLCRRGAASWLAGICVVFQKSAV